jgi:hypothetical protein
MLCLNNQIDLFYRCELALIYFTRVLAIVDTIRFKLFMYGMYLVKVISISSCPKAADGIIPTCAKGNVAVISLMNFGMNLCKSVSP